MNQMHERLAVMIRGKLTSHARFSTPPTLPGVDRDPDSSNVASIPTALS